MGKNIKEVASNLMDRAGDIARHLKRIIAPKAAGTAEKLMGAQGAGVIEDVVAGEERGAVNEISGL